MAWGDQERMDQVKESVFRARIEAIILARIEKRLDDEEQARDLAKSIMDSVYTPIATRWYSYGVRDWEEAMTEHE